MTGVEITPKRFKCTMCPKDYAQKSGVAAHMKTKHVEQVRMEETVAEVMLSLIHI